MPPPEVGVVTVQPRDVGLITELPGRLEASRIAQVRARAAGIVQERLFREGSDVKAGQPLYRIDACALRGRAGQRAGDAGARPGQPGPGQGPGRALPPAGGSQRDQQAGIRQRGGRAEGRPRPRWRPAKRAVKVARINLGYALGECADLRPHRPLAGDRRRAGRPGRSHAAGHDPADQPAVRQHHPVLDRGPQPAARAGAGPAEALRARTRPWSRWCWRMAACTRRPAACCSPTCRSTRPPARSRCAPKCPIPGPAAARHVRARAAGAGHRRQRRAAAAAGRHALATGRQRDGGRRRTARSRRAR